MEETEEIIEDPACEDHEKVVRCDVLENQETIQNEACESLENNEMKDDTACQDLGNKDLVESATCHHLENNKVIECAPCEDLENKEVIETTSDNLKIKKVIDGTCEDLEPEKIIESTASDDLENEEVCEDPKTKEVIESTACDDLKNKEVCEDPKTKEVIENTACDDLENKEVCEDSKTKETIESTACNDLENKEVCENSKAKKIIETLACDILKINEAMEYAACEDLENEEVIESSASNDFKSEEMIVDAACDIIENKEIQSTVCDNSENKVMEVTAFNELENKDFSTELKAFPHILEYIEKLQEQIKIRKKELEVIPHMFEYIEKLQEQIKVHKKELKVKLQHKEVYCKSSDSNFVDNQTQTDLSSEEPPQDWVISTSKETGSIADQVKEAAESALVQTGFVYEETTGLYYHYESGYYYDPKSGLYYDGNNGTYYYYDKSTKTYKFHSQISKESTEPMETSESTRKKAKKDIKINKGRAKRIKLSKEAEENDSIEVIDIEDGECSDSDSEYSSSSIEVITIGSPENEYEDVAKEYAPCMRIIVKETNIPKLKIGTLFLVPCTGGSIGREGDHPVVIRDINISKHHAKLQYNEDKKVYEIVDLGSRNGTIVNGKRISAAKQESEPTEIVHGATIQLGETKLLCHIHKGHETCGHCEPGLLQSDIIAEPTYRSAKASYESEMKRIKQKFGLNEDNTQASRVVKGYWDRAQSRRKEVGSSCQSVKTQQSSLNEAISKDNTGFKMLAKMGWTEGTSLGKNGTGLTEPVPVVHKVDKAGLGATSHVPGAEGDLSIGRKQVMWKKAQQRYDEITK